MVEGFRPELDFPGFWLYLGDTPCIHIAEWQSYSPWTKKVGIPISTRAAATGPVDHIAFNGTGFAEVRARLVERGLNFSENLIDDIGSSNCFYATRTASRSRSISEARRRTELKTTDYGFIGVGRMGAHMARRLLKAGISLTVYDTSKEATAELAKDGAQVAGSALEVANNTEIAFLSLPTPDIVQKVCAGLTDAKRLKVVVDCSTTGPGVARIAHAELAKAGIVYMDAPVSGGMAGARDGTLAVMVSGQKAVYDRIEPAMKQFGKLFYCGEGAGLAQVMKLANNIIAAGVIVMSAEVIAMGMKAGLNPRQMCEIINAGSGRNSATQDKFPRSVLPGTFDFGFATGLSYKDVRLCLEEADAQGVPMPVGAEVFQMLGVTKARSGADSDFTCIAKVYEEWAGVEMRG